MLTKKICTAERLREADRAATEKYGIPGIVLMENAAASCASEVMGFSSFVVLCGKGNNAGDGFAIARRLINAGKSVKVYLTLGDSFSGDAGVNFEILKNMSVGFYTPRGDDLKTDIMLADCVIDAVFGTGLHGDVGEDILNIFDTVNSLAKYVLSVDVPSGIDANFGRVCGGAVRADKTVTFAAYKRGLLLYPAAEYAGEIKLCDISIPEEAFSDVRDEVSDGALARRLFPKRRKNTHKGDYGKVLIIGGSVGMAGAVCLAARAAFAVGAGLVTACVPREINDIVVSNVPEAMTLPLDKAIAGKVNGFDAVLFGNGIGRDALAADILSELLKEIKVPLVIDADGLYALSQNRELLSLCGEKTVLTPHTMEMARLLGVSADEIEENRFDRAYDFAAENGSTLVLKGNHTIITAPDGRRYVNINGNSGMATAGSGDVLAGMTAGLLPRLENAFDAAVLSVYLHGAAGDNAAAALGENSMTAGHIIDAISHILPVEI